MIKSSFVIGLSAGFVGIVFLGYELIKNENALEKRRTELDLQLKSRNTLSLTVQGKVFVPPAYA